MRRYESGAGCGTRERGQIPRRRQPRPRAASRAKACLGNRGPAGPAAVNAISGAMPRGALLAPAFPSQERQSLWRRFAR